jgi:sulfate transport system substrate-binding protein
MNTQIRNLVIALYALPLFVALSCSTEKPAATAPAKDKSAESSPSPAAEPTAKKKDVELLNVSYDPTRELWKELNGQFARQFATETGRNVTIKQSHGGSSSQARSVIDGLEADVVTLALWADIDAIRKSGLISAGWEDRLPNKSLPYYSTIVFVVRRGNPKQIKDWSDLVRGDIKIVTPSPKTSGNGKLSLLAAWGSVTERGGSEDDARKFLSELYQHTPVLDSGARAATTTFAQKGIGDVHLTWENEAYLEVKESGDALEIVYPPLSIRAEPPVAVVDKNAKSRDTLDVATAYLQFLYTDAGQDTIAKHFYRPNNASVQARYAQNFPEIKLFPVTAVAKSWDDAQAKFFAEGAIFDQIYSNAKK